jgi:RNA polymerase sigma-70 factor (ECF subfamily)
MGGEMQGPLRLLNEDAVFIADGGGRVAAGTRPVTGADKVARGMLGGIGKYFAGIDPRVEEVNGQPAVVGYLGGEPAGAALLEISGERVQRIYLVVNPDKLDALRRAARDSA